MISYMQPGINMLMKIYTKILKNKNKNLIIYTWTRRKVVSKEIDLR